MGLFDLFKQKTKSTNGPPLVGQDKNLAKLSRIVGDRLQQTYDRRDAINALSELRTKEAIAALLRRFTFHVDPSTDDQEEKDNAFDGIVAAGPVAIEPVLKFCERAESLTWPLRILKSVVTDDVEYYDKVIELLDSDSFSTEYTRNVDPKLQLLGELEGCKTSAAYDAVEPFLDDVNEPVRFHAATTLLSFADARAVERLCVFAAGEESVRIRNKIAEGFAQHAWPVPQAHRDAFASAIATGGYRLSASGHVATP